MTVRRFALITLALVLAAGAGLQATPAAAADPQLRVRDSGRMVVRWDDRCVVRYDAGGARRSAESGCSSSQRSRSDEMVRRHLRTAGPGGSGGQMADPRFTRKGGGAEASYPNGCTVEYDRQARRRDANRACTSAQLQRADRRAGRFLNVAGGGGTGAGLEFVERGGRPEAVYDDGCRVFYDENGERTDSNRACTPAQVQKADRRLQQVWTRPSGAGRPIGRPVIDERSRYLTQLRFPDGCNVNYDRDGRRTGTSGPCTQAHRQQADRTYRNAQR